MTNTKMKMPVLIEPLISTLHNIQSKIDDAAGALIALELRLRIIAQLEPKVQEELKKKTSDFFYEANLSYLITAVLEVFQEKLDPAEQELIKSCRMPRNKLAHASFVEFLIELNGEAEGRVIDPKTGKKNSLEKHDLVEGAKCIERGSGLPQFSSKVKITIQILESKIMRHLET